MSSEIEESRAGSKGMYVGQRYKIYPVSDEEAGTATFNSGGAGYALDAVALGKLGVAVLDDKDICLGKKQIPGTCDKPIGECLGKLGIFAQDTRDKHRRDRFHHFNPTFLWFLYYDPSSHIYAARPTMWWGVHSFFSSGVSSDSVAMHAVKLPGDMVHIRKYMLFCRPLDPFVIVLLG